MAQPVSSEANETRFSFDLIDCVSDLSRESFSHVTTAASSSSRALAARSTASDHQVDSDDLVIVNKADFGGSAHTQPGSPDFAECRRANSDNVSSFFI